MGDINQLEYVRSISNLVKGKILEVGSRDYGNTPNYRVLFPSNEYIGVDMSAGNNVDVVIDISANYETLANAIGGRVSTIICCSVLEHVKNIWSFCDNLSRLLEKDGIIIISAPFAWRIHAYPDDYWRFTPNGIKALFHSISFIDERTQYTWASVGKIFPESDPQHYSITKSNFWKYGLVRGSLAFIMRKARLLPDHWLEGVTLPPSMINMVGCKKVDD